MPLALLTSKAPECATPRCLARDLREAGSAQRYNLLVDWIARFEAELQKAGNARARGNEGKARVCARRAAGIVAAEYYARRGTEPGSASALVVLEKLHDDPSVSPDILRAISNLLLRVDEEFALPAGVDLIADARQLRDGLLTGK